MRGLPTLASVRFLLPWRLACTVPLVVALTSASTDVRFRKPCGTCVLSGMDSAGLKHVLLPIRYHIGVYLSRCGTIWIWAHATKHERFVLPHKTTRRLLR